MTSTQKLLISAGCAVLFGILSVFSQVLLLPVIALAACIGAAWGAGYLIPSLAACAACKLLFVGADTGTVCELVMFICAAVLLTACEKKALPHRYAVLGLAVIFCIGQYLSMALGSIIAGLPPYEGLLTEWENVIYPRMAEYFSGSVGADSLEVLKEVSEIIPDTLMWICVLSGEAYAIACYMLMRLWQKILKLPRRAMAKLPDWRLPQSVTVGSLIMLAAIGLVYLLRLNQANAIAYTLGLIIASLFAVQGFCYLSFMFRAGGAPGLVNGVLWVFTLIFFPYSMGLLAFFGIKEQLLKKRPKIRQFLAEQRERESLNDKADELAKYGYIRKKDERDGDRDGE